MIVSKVYRLLKEASPLSGHAFPLNHEFEIVRDVVYGGGNPLPPNMQGMFYEWITKNPKLFKDDTRSW